MRKRVAESPESRMNRAIARPSSSIVVTFDLRPVTPEVAGSSPVAPVFHAQKTCKLASSVAHQGANDRRSLFHPAYIPHGNRRRKPAIAADSRDPDYRSIGRSFSDVANHVPTRGPSTGLRPGGPQASGYPRGGRVRSPARR